MPRPSFREILAFGEAAAFLAMASLAIRLLPFRTVVRLMGRTDPLAGGSVSDPTRVRQAVKRASRRLPLRTLCFQEGLAAHWMLRRRGQPSRLHYGIRHQAGILTAHVWIDVNGVTVIGQEESGSAHSAVAVYPAAAASALPLTHGSV